MSLAVRFDHPELVERRTGCRRRRSGSGRWNAILAERVWVANRCIQMNAQQIASMPLHFEGATEPAWVSNPDPNWFPNGVGDAIHSIVRNVYGWGFAIIYVTSRYADGYPQNWTVVDSCRFVTITLVDEYGAREYRIYNEIVDSKRMT